MFWLNIRRQFMPENYIFEHIQRIQTNVRREKFECPMEIDMYVDVYECNDACLSIALMQSVYKFCV